MTWGQYKKEVEEQGLKDDDVLRSIHWDADHVFHGVDVVRPIGTCYKCGQKLDVVQLKNDSY